MKTIRLLLFIFLTGTLAHVGRSQGADLGPDIVACQGATVCLTVTTSSGGTFPIGSNYNWMKNGLPVVSPNAPTFCISTSTPGTCTFSVTVTTPSGTVNSDAVDVTINANPTVTATNPTLDWCCADGPLILGYIWNGSGNLIPFSNTLGGNLFSPTPGLAPWIFGGPPAAAYTALPPCGISTVPVIFGLATQIVWDPCSCPAGTYPVTYTYTDANGCSASETMNIVVGSPPPPPLLPAPLTIDLCVNDAPVTLGAGCIFGGTGAWTSTTAPAGSFNFATGEFDPCVAASSVPVTYDFTFTCTNACGSTSGTTSVTINATPPPPPFITAPSTIDQCSAPVTLGAGCSVSGGTGAWTSTTAPAGSFNLGTGVFDPSLALPGTYNFTYTCTIGSCASCSSSSTTFIVVNAGIGDWHQTTTNSAQRDQGNGVYADPDGFVFNTGFFIGQTDITGLAGGLITITASGPSSQAAYISCHDDCGNLIWTQHCNVGDKSDGIDLKSDENFLYVTVNHTGVINLIPQGTASIPAPVEFGGTTILYALDKATGDFIASRNQLATNGFRSFALDVRQSPISLAVDEVYLCGDVTDLTVNEVYFERVDFNGTTFSPVWLDRAFSTASAIGAGKCTARDIEFDDLTNRVFATGGDQRDLTFITSGSTIVPAATALRDAYFVMYTSGGAFLGARQMGAVNFSEGRGTVTDDTQHLYFAGNFNEGSGLTIPTPFGIAIVPTLTQAGAGQNGYLVGIQLGPTLAFSDNVSTSLGQNVVVTDAANNANQVVIGGRYLGGTYDGALGPISCTTNPVNESRLIVSAWDHTPPGWTPLYDNVSLASGGLPSGDHFTGRVSLGVNNGYVTGRYKGYLDYCAPATFPPPTSGPLTSVGGDNAYIIRIDLSNGDFRSDDNEGEAFAGGADFDDLLKEDASDQRSSLKQTMAAKVYPNPGNGLITLSISGHQAESVGVQVFNSIGARVMDRSINTSLSELDFSGFEAGMYLIKVSSGEQEITLPLVIN